MQKKIILVRHGQSDANAGAVANTSFSEIPLTEKGKEQARKFAETLEGKPNLIICSPFLRTKQTCQPLRDKYPDVPFEIDENVREFSYICPEFAFGKTIEQRKQRVNEYWSKLDPSFHDSESVECFSQFVERAKAFIKCVHQRKENFTVVFSHALYMILIEIVLKYPNDSDLEIMKKFSIARKERNFENCGVLEIC